jgi:hypothetical protein
MKRTPFGLLSLLVACSGMQETSSSIDSDAEQNAAIGSEASATDWDVAATPLVDSELGATNPDEDGRNYEVFRLVLEAGSTVRVWVHSEDFDTTLRLRGPDGLDLYNDDYWHGTDSMVQFQVGADGEHELVLSSYGIEEAGAYQLNAYVFTPDDMHPSLSLGETITADLADSDAGPGSGDDNAGYWFEARAGQRVRLRVTSPVFDTTATLVSPTGQHWYNDDANDVGDDGTESTLDSTIDAIAPHDGWYQLIVAPYGGQSAGAFTVASTYREAVTVGPDELTPDVGFAGTETMGRMYGIYTGITNYGPDDQLYGCADDASNIADAFQVRRMQAPEDQVVLRDKDASSAAFEAAVRDLAARTTQDDLVMIFYSGHGGTQAVDEEADQVELDGTDETLVFIDRQMTDNEFVELMGLFDVNTLIVAIDACQSGGFARDFMTEPGRIGLFSSDEDVLSSTAEPVEAGGYLSYMVHQAVLGWGDAMPNDGAMLAGEFTDFMVETAAAQHRNMNPEGSTSPLQRIIIERGSYNWADMLWVFPRNPDGSSIGVDCAGTVGDNTLGATCQ